MKTLAWICIAMLIFLSAYLYDANTSLEQENRALRKNIKDLNERLDISTELNNDLNEELDIYTELNNEPNDKIYLPPSVHNTKKRLEVGDEFPAITALRGSVKTSVKATIKRSINTGDVFNKETVVTFEPGKSLTMGGYTYSSPTGATIHVDDNGNITQIQGTVYRQ